MENVVILLSLRTSSEEHLASCHILPLLLLSCLKATRIYPPDTYRRHPLRDSGDQVVHPRVVHVLYLWIRFGFLFTSFYFSFRLPFTSFPFSFLSCLKATHIYPPVTYRKHLLRDSGVQVGSPQGGSCSTPMNSIWASFHIRPLLLPIVSQGNTHLPPRHIQKTPTQGV